MGIELLEEKFLIYSKRYPERLPYLKSLAIDISTCQRQIRSILNDLTSTLCSICDRKCCSGMPCDGYFTIIDYFAYRMIYNMPEISRISYANPRDCSFLSMAGCTLPEDMRPIACVKVNCDLVNKALKETDRGFNFRILCETLDNLQYKIWVLINEGVEQNGKF